MVAIRPTRTEDLAQVTRLEAATDTAAWLSETGRTWHEQALADPDQEHLVIDDNGALTGFLVLAGIQRDDRAVELRRMVVHPDVRGTGCGRALLKAALVRAYEHHDARRVWLDVKAHNLRARALYESEGFVTTDTLAAAVTEADGSAADLKVMVHNNFS